MGVLVQINQLFEIDLRVFDPGFVNASGNDVSLAVAMAITPGAWPEGVTPVERTASLAGFTKSREREEE